MLSQLFAGANGPQRAGILNLLPLITHRAAFDDAPDLFARLDRGEPGLLQAVLEFGRGE